MATITFKGLEEYEKKIVSMSKEIDKICGAAAYVGGGIVADEIRKGIESLPVVSGFGTERNPLPGGVTKTQKRGLLEGLGISKMKNDSGFYNVKIGFDGYNKTKTEKFPQGQPNQAVARGVESGTTWKKKYPFVRPAVERARKTVLAKMAETVDKEIEKVVDK